MNRGARIDEAGRFASDGRLEEIVGRRVAVRTVSTDAALAGEVGRYHDEQLGPGLIDHGFILERWENPASPRHPFLYAERREPDSQRSVLLYGHADVQPPQTAQWSPGLDPWTLTVDGDRWYGRGAADNKIQHTINLEALYLAIDSGQQLGFTAGVLIESGEEAGSPGLLEVCRAHADRLTADVFIASDGPRIAADRPTIVLGSRGTSLIRLDVNRQDQAYYSATGVGCWPTQATDLRTRSPISVMRTAFSRCRNCARPGSRNPSGRPSTA